MSPGRQREALLFCSFCRRDQDRVAKLVGGPGVYICDQCVEICNRILAGRPAPPFPGWEALSDADLLRTLSPAAAAAMNVDWVLREHVAELRRRGVSWSRVGAALGVSRQAAWERFSADA